MVFQAIGQCLDPPRLVNGHISFDFSPMLLRPHYTVATYTCDTRYQLSAENSTRTCVAGNWTGSDYTCGMIVILNVF